MAEDPAAAAALGHLVEKAGDAPTLLPEAQPFWRAYWQLQGDRQRVPTPVPLPMGGFTFVVREGRTPFVAIDRWARRYGWRDGDFDMLLHLLAKMDEEHDAVQAGDG